MDTVTLKVADIAPADRYALEHAFGVPLHEHRQVVLKVVEISEPEPIATGKSEAPALPEWCNVYAGMSDEDVDRLDRAIRQRLDLTRDRE
jgi:hypothetical protein